MNKKVLAFIVIIGICMFFFFLFGETEDIRSEDKGKDGVVDRPILIADIDKFKELERPSVGFYHDKHTVALEKESCGVCHPQDEKGRFIFTYPKLRDDKTEERLRKSYHDNCIGCHNERSKLGKKSGPVTCGECHVLKKQPADWLRSVELDYYLHYQHEKSLEKKCELCHHIYSEEEKKLLYKKETESSCRDCHREKDEEKRRSFRNVAHSDCINCHIERKNKGKKAGPFACIVCHLERKQPTSEEIAGVPKPDRKQPGKVLIKIEDSRMKEVPFDHKTHEGYTRSCRTCHHETLNGCKKCHTLKGSKEGGGVTLAEAYHQVSSQWSCIGCHELQKSEPSCSGCHHLMKGGLTEASCGRCHSGPLGEVRAVSKLDATIELLPEKLAEEINITVLEKEYKPAKFPHSKIIKKLTNISDKNKLASYFHSDKATVCLGCHHYSPIEPKKHPPYCSTCHTITFDLRDLKKPRLVAAYHRQCMACHQKMNLKALKCIDCHAEKRK
ncbi:MAG: sulfate respiration complex hexadecaheme cytochrome HmcA [Pseudomonadota bacterium]